jgi:hypothetical protein
MADQKITELDELTSVADTDVLPIVDDPSGSPVTKRITRANLLSGYLTAAAGAAAYQPLDSDLTAIAALTTTSYGRALLALADEAALKAAVNLEIGTDVQAFDADLSAIAALSPSNDDLIQRKAGAWTNRTMAQLIADLAALGTTFQPLDSDLTAIAALTTTSFGRSLLAAADAAALRTLAGAVIGTNVQAWDTDLDAIAALGVTNDSIIQGKAGVWAKRTIAQLITDLALVHTINFVIDGGGAVISTGIKGDLVVDFACTVTAWTILGDQTGSIVVDIWRDSYANFPPVVGDSMTGAEKPTISSATKGQDTSLASGAGWAIAAGDVLRFNVDSVTSLTRATVALKVTRT